MIHLPEFRLTLSACCLILSSLTHGCLQADPLQDQRVLKQLYKKTFPQLQLQDYADGVYAIDETARESWQAIEEFPPYEPAIDAGEITFSAPFKNGKTYADCFLNKGIGVANTYPQWDSIKNEVITLPVAINNCRTRNDEPALPYKKGPLTNILAYMVYTTRGKPVNVTIPADNPKALAAYEEGKQYYYQRRGQLNFSCASCHVQNAGKHIRAEILSPMLGHTSGWPTYRLKWGEMGTLHRRFIGCHEQIRATPFPAQSKEFRNLEYFMSFISNGVPVNGPVTRK